MAAEVRIVGTRSFAAEVADFARDAGLEVAGLLEPFDPARVGTRIHGLAVESLEQGPAEERAVLIGTGESARRETVERTLEAGWEPAALVHPAAHLASSASVGQGAIVGPGAVVGAFTEIDDYAVLGRGSLIGHHTSIGAHCTLGPGANVAGNVVVEPDAFLGMACAIRDHVTIGAGAVVAMGAVVIASVPAGHQVRGVPARPPPSR